jgi:hypothetical protein
VNPAVLGPAPAAQTINDVIARMQSIQDALPANDGVACFNRMYLQVTEGVNQRVQQGLFGDAAFMTRLDVVFANRYFAAIDAMSGPIADVPKAWQPLIAARSAPGIEPIQFAFAGMNAHINFDLPLAVVSTCSELATEPSAGSHYDDYLKINTLLDAAEQAVRESFEPPELVNADRHFAGVTNIVANWSINSARDVAWDTATALWDVRDHDLATKLLTGALVRTVAMVSCGLLAVI